MGRALGGLVQSNLLMVKTEREHRCDIVEVGRLMFQKGWVAANDGNITIRLDAERILATPTGVSKGMMHEDDLLLLDPAGATRSQAGASGLPRSRCT